MRALIDTYKNTGTLSHAYLIEGDPNTTSQEIFAFLEDHMGVKKEGNPDVWHDVCETFGIEQSRVLKEMQTRQAIGEHGRFFVVGAGAFTTEAQNALLKTFEEPTQHTHFFVVVPNPSALLPTLRSRFVIITNSTKAQYDTAEARAFLKRSPKDRLEFIKPIVDDKDKQKAKEFIAALSEVCQEEVRKGELSTDMQGFCDAVVRAERYIHARSASVKMILETLALLAPRS